MDNAKSQLIDRLKTANSVLITVSRNPSVDQLAACIGLTLVVNKLGKHGSAVFSGEVPSTIEFLKPEETIEKTADSLRDFIIALDKNKADKLRYKVEDQVVKIFITPYKTSLSDKDLEFSQGDFNVELVVALGVKKQEDLDQAIVSHGRILHDATVACINTTDTSELGTINWQDPAASSLCELVTNLATQVGENTLDEQIATALLTGIIAETDRFSNQKTTSQTMSVSGQLMAAGANQQLVATSLSAPVSANLKVSGDDKKDNAGQTDDGTLSIKHDDSDLELSTLPKPTDEPESEIVKDHREPLGTEPIDPDSTGPRLVTEPPTLGGTLTANSVPEQYDPSIDPLSGGAIPTPTLSQPNTDIEPILAPPTDAAVPTVPQPAVTPPQPTYTPPPPTWTPPPTPIAPPVEPAPTPVAPPVEPTPQIVEAPAPEPVDTTPQKDQTLNELEQAVNSPHLKMTDQQTDVDSAREQIDAIRAEAPSGNGEPDLALNALPLGDPLHETKEEPKPETNTTGLDPSLFSEPPDKAPPVAPPLPLNLPTDNTDGSAPK